MSRNQGLARTVAVALVFEAVASVFFFVVPLWHTRAFWAAYLFSWVAVGVSVAVIAWTASDSKDATSSLYRASSFTYAAVYLVAGIVVNLLFALALDVPAWVVVVVNVAMAAALVVVAVAGNSGAALVEGDEAQTAASTSAMRQLSTTLGLIAPVVADAGLASDLAALREDVRYSDPVGTPGSAQLEQQLAAAAGALGRLVDAGDVGGARRQAQSMRALLAQRNQVCRDTKQRR